MNSLLSVPDDPYAGRVVADVLGRPPAGDHEGRKIDRIYIGKRQVGVPTVAWLEVMHDETQCLLAGRGAGDFVAFLFQVLLWIQHFERLRSVIGQNQNLESGMRHRLPNPVGRGSTV